MGLVSCRIRGPLNVKTPTPALNELVGDNVGGKLPGANIPLIVITPSMLLNKPIPETVEFLLKRAPPVKFKLSNELSPKIIVPVLLKVHTDPLGVEKEVKKMIETEPEEFEGFEDPSVQPGPPEEERFGFE